MICCILTSCANKTQNNNKKETKKIDIFKDPSKYEGLKIKGTGRIVNLTKEGEYNIVYVKHLKYF